MFARPFVLGDLNLTRQIIRDTLAPTDYQISLLIRVDCSRDGIKLLHRIMSAFGHKADNVVAPIDVRFRG